MKKFGVILYSLLCILLLGACKEDEYVYPNVITTFIDAATDESGTLQKLITDKGESLQILNREGLDGLTPDSIYRSVSIYELKESADEGQATALLYSCRLQGKNCRKRPPRPTHWIFRVYGNQGTIST